MAKKLRKSQRVPKNTGSTATPPTQGASIIEEKPLFEDDPLFEMVLFWLLVVLLVSVILLPQEWLLGLSMWWNGVESA